VVLHFHAITKSSTITQSLTTGQVLKETLNKSPLARRRLCGMRCAKGDGANGAAAQGGAVSSEGRCDPVAGCLRPNKTVVRSKHPLRCPIPALRGPSGDAPGRPFVRSLTRQTARKTPPHKGCGKIGRSPRCAPWHRSPGYDLRRAPYDHPDFTSNALSEDLFSASLRKR